MVRFHCLLLNSSLLPPFISPESINCLNRAVYVRSFVNFCPAFVSVFYLFFYIYKMYRVHLVVRCVDDLDPKSDLGMDG